MIKLEKKAEEKKQEILEIAKNSIAPCFSNQDQLSTMQIFIELKPLLCLVG